MFYNLRIRVVRAFWCLACALLGAGLIDRAAGDSCVAAAETTCPTNCSPLPRPGDELWEVSSRRAGCRMTPLDYRSYQANAWRLANEQVFLAAEQSPKTTVFYVHGLAVTAGEAMQEGRRVYSALAQCAAPEVSFRFVLYSWPSAIERRPLRTARCKQRDTDIEGLRLARLIGQLSPQTPISLIGHSSGARVVAAALETLADRSATGPELAPATPPVSRPLRAVLIAGAVDNNGLLPRHSYGRAISQVEQMLILFNPCDRVLHWYRFLERGHSGPEAVGYTGLASRYLPPAESAKLRQINSSPYVGSQHVIAVYTASASLLGRVRAAALFDH